MYTEPHLKPNLILFDYVCVHAHALSQLIHLIKTLFSQTSNLILVLTICLQTAKKHLVLLMKGGKKN